MQIDRIPPVPIGAGFLAPDVALPAPSPPLDAAQRERAARIVVAIGRMLTPEEFIAGAGSERIDAAMADPLMRGEAEDWAGLVARAILPAPEAL